MSSHWVLVLTIVCIALMLSCAIGAGAVPADLKALVGKSVDIAPSAYRYRADRKADANDPESWFALMRYAGLPLNKPVDLKAPAVQSVLCGLLWEEIRPVDRLVLTWPGGTQRRPAPKDLAVATLDNQGTASSWWNNLTSTAVSTEPTVSPDGTTFTYELRRPTCGIVLAVPGRAAKDFDVPEVRVFVADTWKSMDVELEWGFEKDRAAKDYSGGIEAHDGRLGAIQPLDGDDQTAAAGPAKWKSAGKASSRRGVKFNLLYMGTSKWRKEIPYTSQRDDVARTIVTVRTKSGGFSFLAADLENGPILAPEYGFFVRRSSRLAKPGGADERPIAQDLLTSKMDSVAGSKELKALGSAETPWFGGNPTDRALSVAGIDFPAKRVAMHPGPDKNVAVGWRSPIDGSVKVHASVAHAQKGSDGIEWWIVLQSGGSRTVKHHGATDGSGAQETSAAGIVVKKGDSLALVVGPKGTHTCDTTLIEFTVSQMTGEGRTWDLTSTVADDPQAANPRADAFGNPAVWSIYTEDRTDSQLSAPAEPPIDQASKATTGREFLDELAGRKLQTVRQQVREQPEQTWEDAMAAFHPGDLPQHPEPPSGMETPMMVVVPSERLTAQWNLAKWHMLRHCGTNPKTGKLWFNDFPYGILAAETYMVLHVVDLIGSPKEAEAGYDQWTMLPMDTDSAGHNEGALRDRPNGLFTDGHGCLTAAVGPDGWGGQMDGVHAFGPGAIGWALAEHYLLSGDTAWLKANAPRIMAGADWMARQRRVMTGAVPGGERLWCKGLQPALQVTPDSGGLWMQFYEAEAYYWLSMRDLAECMAEVDPAGAAKLKAEAEAYAKDLRAAVDRSITLSPVVQVRDGTYHSVIPFGCYVRGLGTGAWGWNRDGSGSHVGPLYWETVQSAAALVSPAGLLPAGDVRVQGYLDVLEDRLLFENARADKVAWFDRGFHYQLGLERTANMHLTGDDAPSFLRTWLNGYAVDVLPNVGYTFNEHVYRGPEDKIYEEAAFLERFRNMLVMEDGPRLWLCRATPRAWLEQGKRISVSAAPTHFGEVSYEVVSDVDQGRISATVSLPSRGKAEVWLRLRLPGASTIQSVTVDGKPWKDFDAKLEVVKLRGLNGAVKVEVRYGHS